MTVTNLQELETLIQRVKAAQAQYATYTQQQVDEIFKKAALAANAARIPLAKMAVEETGMGVVEDKVIKNHFASEMIYNKYKQEKTCGVIEADKHYGIQKLAEPVGILAGIVPTTNPTSTAIFKALIALKTRNAIIFSPHPRAKKCTVAAAKIVLEAAVAAGAPEDIIGWIDEPTLPISQAFMQHPDINLILATGGPGMVKAAYSSGKPSLGVGAGNTPAVIDETADIRVAVSSILLSKTFDNGMICASEQAVVVVDEVYEAVKQEFSDRGAYFLNSEEADRVRGVLLKEGRLNAAIVGQPVTKIAELAGIEVAEGTKVLIGEAEEVSVNEPFAYEKLSPVLGMYRLPDFHAAVATARELIAFGGRGHTSVLYTAPANEDRILYFESQLPTGRVLINTPSSQGAIGDLYNFKLDPSLTLGCGTWGGNSVSENVSVHHLLNIKTVSERRENMLWFRVPPKIYFKYGCLPVALRDLVGKKRAFLITDKPLFDMGMLKQVTEILDEIGIEHLVFYDVKPDPDLTTINKGVAAINNFQPDVMIAFGGGSPMDAAKIMWLMYENPEVEFEGIATRFMDIRKRVYELPPLGNKAIMVAIPTTSGTGSEVTPFAVVTDDRTGIKYPLADYALTPHIAIVDPELVLNMPKKLTAYGGIDALTHALEAYVSVLATEFTEGLALEAIALLMEYLPRSYQKGADDPVAREKVHYAATIAGMAFANAFLGICHSMAHKLGSTFHLPHGLANALMISHVIRYNATDAPFKQAIFPQYEYPHAKERYAKIADHLHLGGDTIDEKIEKLVEAVENLKQQVEIPLTIKEALHGEDREFYEQLEELSEQAFDDQCTGANPRYPLIRDLKELFVLAYQGCRLDSVAYHTEVDMSRGVVESETKDEPEVARV
ncbi:bifunctional acetaldehyde-CoA/alcohol dehydrogenase [Oscillatoria salina]|uniref:bifunctional acetaldehyde-CoA/alcohol dehydrogenase n=1 Tax=Oscillatoria salina TaxID=331517 RepID=UPI0013BD3DFB|nr:bifunctional acetaldehyde-CoA/alcohol dehydrogenase [Oscillatoria salina]MBZ8180102.1 bifunctional acetaldehyde-CoA/alcohol dehydrogenase [Oscillatoria salina IIICB1]NET89303.1 bifunctional acetaldehyde-CoA/alcohol dehydrogenase [Kamptonema sp. SIO1D9]